MNDLRNYLESIRDDLNALYNEEWTDEEREALEEQGEPCDLWEYLEEVLDVEYILDSRFCLVGCKVYVALGGPNIHINTQDDTIVGYWGADHEVVYINQKISEWINDYYRELIPRF